MTRKAVHAKARVRGISSSRRRRRASSRRNSLNAPGLRPEVRRDRGGPLFHRWYQQEDARYTRPDPQRDWPIFQVYGYAEQNPLFRSDLDGLVPIRNPYVGDPFMKLGCIGGATLRAASEVVGARGPRWAHCFASCEIAKCGGAGIARDLGLLKEGFDTVTCFGLKKLGSLGGRATSFFRKKQCDSAFQPEDFKDNKRGISCPKDVPCDVACRGLEGVENTAPGPFGEPPFGFHGPK